MVCEGLSERQCAIAKQCMQTCARVDISGRGRNQAYNNAELKDLMVDTINNECITASDHGKQRVSRSGIGGFLSGMGSDAVTFSCDLDEIKKL